MACFHGTEIPASGSLTQMREVTIVNRQLSRVEQERTAAGWPHKLWFSPADATRPFVNMQLPWSWRLAQRLIHQRQKWPCKPPKVEVTLREGEAEIRTIQCFRKNQMGKRENSFSKAVYHKQASQCTPLGNRFLTYLKNRIVGNRWILNGVKTDHFCLIPLNFLLLFSISKGSW